MRVLRLAFHLTLPVFLSSYWAACTTGPQDVLKDAVPLAERARAASEGKAVYATGKITSEDRGDPHFVRAGAHLVIQRRGEIYSWVKKTEQVEQTDASGRTVTVEKHGCVLEWTAEPDIDITDNDWCDGDNDHNLRRRFFLDNDRKADLKLTVGEEEFSVSGDPVFINIPDLSLTKRDMSQPFHLLDGYFYIGSFCAENTDHGCERVKFLGKEYDREATYTVVGALEGQEFKPLVVDGREFLFLGAGDMGAVMDHASDLE